MTVHWLLYYYYYYSEMIWNKYPLNESWRQSYFTISHFRSFFLSIKHVISHKCFCFHKFPPVSIFQCDCLWWIEIHRFFAKKQLLFPITNMHMHIYVATSTLVSASFYTNNNSMFAWIKCIHLCSVHHLPLRQSCAVVSHFSSFFFTFESFFYSILHALSIFIMMNTGKIVWMWIYVKPFSARISDRGIILVIYKWETMKWICSLFIVPLYVHFNSKWLCTWYRRLTSTYSSLVVILLLHRCSLRSLFNVPSLTVHCLLFHNEFSVQRSVSSI